MVNLKANYLAGALLAFLGAAAPPVYAHHSFAATYVVDQTVTFEGTVVDFLYRYPHAFLHVAARDKNGGVTEWAVEWAAAGVLANQGVSADILQPGDKVVVTGSPARDEKLHRIRLKAILRPSDGWKWAGTFG